MTEIQEIKSVDPGRGTNTERWNPDHSAAFKDGLSEDALFLEDAAFPEDAVFPEDAAFLEDAAFPETAPDMNQFLLPEQENCGSNIIPYRSENEDGTRTAKVPVLVSMTDIFFKRYEADVFRHLNHCLRNGIMDTVIGNRIYDREISRRNCRFPHVSYWRISRENFYTDLAIELKLKTAGGPVTWKGFLVCNCGFDEEDLFCVINHLTDMLDRKAEGLIPLTKHLSTVASNRDVDRLSEELWRRFLPEALEDASKRKAVKLAGEMELSILYRNVYDHQQKANSIVFFKEDDLYIGKDIYVKDTDGEKKHIKDRTPTSDRIPADTIVINTNCIRKQYSDLSIFHECYHYEYHYLFYRLQELRSNDIRQMPTKDIVVKKNEVVKNDIYFMGKQANRGGMGLMMPASHTRKLMYDELGKVKDYRNTGDRAEIAGFEMWKKIHVPCFRIKTRMLQLGHIEARGAFNYVNRTKIEPFGFNRDSWRDSSHTFVVWENVVHRLQKKNPDLDELITSGRYVWADGHVVQNDPAFVFTEKDASGERLKITEEGLKHIDDCCLRFTQTYVQRDVGTYVPGRMYCDTDYLKQIEFYLADTFNKKRMEGERITPIKAKALYRKEFPRDFKEAVSQLKKQNRKRGLGSNEKLAEYFQMDDSTLSRWLGDPKFYRDEDFLTLLCLYFRLPDFISELVFKAARFQLDEEDDRHRAIMEILRVQSNDGREAADDFLISNELEPLRLKG